MTKRTWVPLCRIEKGGHRLFKLHLGEFTDAEEHPGLYLADNSGSTPDLTDDGPLRIDTTRSVYVDNDDPTRWIVPVLVEERTGSTRKSRVGVGVAGMMTLLRQCPDLTVAYAATLQPLAHLIRLATEPGADRCEARQRCALRELEAEAEEAATKAATMRFIVWDPEDGPVPRDDDGAIATAGTLGRLSLNNVYLTAYSGAAPKLRGLDVGQALRGVVFRLSGERGVYDIYRVE